MGAQEVTVRELEEVSLEQNQELYDSADFDEVYIKKALVLSNTIDNIGFGRYQYGLFVVAGFGWFADNAWPSVTAYILPRLIEVDGVHYPEGRSPSSFVTEFWTSCWSGVLVNFRRHNRPTLGVQHHLFVHWRFWRVFRFSSQFCSRWVFLLLVEFRRRWQFACGFCHHA